MYILMTWHPKAAAVWVMISYVSNVSIRQHTSAYVSIRQHTSAYVSIRQHTSACSTWHPKAAAVWVIIAFVLPSIRA